LAAGAPPPTHELLFASSPGKLMGIVGGDETAAPPPSPPPLPPCPLSDVCTTGPCSITDGGSCATSPNFPSDYPADEGCTIYNMPQVGLEVLAFDVEGDNYPYYDYDGDGDPTNDCPNDYLVVNGVKYCGSSGPAGAAPSDGTMTWVSDWADTRPGWKVCWAAQPPSPPPTPLAALQLIIEQSRGLLAGPVFSELQMCGVVVYLHSDPGTVPFAVSPECACFVTTESQIDNIIYTVTLVVDTFNAAGLAAFVNDPDNEAEVVHSEALTRLTSLTSEWTTDTGTIKIVSVRAAVAAVPSTFGDEGGSGSGDHGSGDDGSVRRQLGRHYRQALKGEEYAGRRNRAARRV